MSGVATIPADAPVDATLQRLTRYALSLGFSALEPEVVHQAKVRLIDTLGAAVAGFSGESAVIARQLAAGRGAAGVTILGTRDKASPEMAAFANAIAARSAEMMDVYHYPGSFGGHPSDVVMPILAAAEAVRCSGKDLIAAIVLGYEIFLRLSDAFRNTGFDDTNFATIATAAIASRLWGLGETRTANAIAIATVANVVLKQVRTDTLTAWKVIATGQSGRAGIFAAMQAKAGMDGPSLPFEGKAGWFDHVARERLSLKGFEPDDRPAKILDTRIKHRAAAGETISSIIAAEKIAPQIDDVDRVTSVTVDLYARALQRAGTGDHHWRPRSRDAAGNSIPYLVATTLLDTTVTLQSYDEAHLRNPRLASLLAKIRLSEDAGFTQAYQRTPVEHRTRVRVTMADGRTLVGESGGDEDDLSFPKTDAQIETKFRNLTAGSLPERAAMDLVASLWTLEDMHDIATIAPRFAATPDSPT